MRYETVLQKMCTVPCISSSQHYNLVTSLNEGLFNNLLVLIYTCSKVLKRNINFFILEDGFTPKQIDTLIKYSNSLGVSTSVIEMSPGDFTAFNQYRLPAAAFYYFKIADILPKWVDRALYLDIDVLVLKDLSEFYDVNLQDSWLAAANEYDGPQFNRYFRELANSIVKYAPWYSSEIIYNSGVMLLNLEKFRSHHIGLSNFIKLIKKEDLDTYLSDQILINRFTGSNIKLFPSAYYNCAIGYTIKSMQCFKHIDRSNEVFSYFKADPEKALSVIHFRGFPSLKPWMAVKEISKHGPKLIKVATGKYDDPITNAEIDKYNMVWWEYAKHIPLDNYLQILSNSIILNAKKDQEQIQHRNNHLNGDILGYANIAPLGTAKQSSISKWSQGPDEAMCALNGRLIEMWDHSFHTNFEDLSWWRVDLNDYYKLRKVVLFNRDHFRERYLTNQLEILFSQDDRNWTTHGYPLLTKDGERYVLDLPGLLYRFVKVQVHHTALHFKRIGIYIS